jgi:hypothetical protein
MSFQTVVPRCDSHGKEVKKVTTGKKAASAAGKVLNDPKATPAEKKAAASDLAQAKKK